VSWSELLGGAPPELRASASESFRFGLEVERLLIGTGTEAADGDVRDLIASSSADLVVLRYPADRVGLFATLLATDRDVLLADQLGYWRLETGTGAAPRQVPGLDVAELEAGDDAHGLVSALVGEIFSGYGNHYLADPVLDPEAALAGYQEWAAASALAATTLVLRHDGTPIGVSTTTSTNGIVEIELAGLLAAHQGNGYYAHLLAGVERHARFRGADHVVISTQAHNTGVQRAWARYGFEPVITFTTVHLLKPGLLGGA
jgi:ribosomal protein S18 acetylase RimI-like enzyme